jgi:2-polyprenyl-3-methyl-5-hydroxy-6-metoxy-1,4-benzoquinol methylase
MLTNEELQVMYDKPYAESHRQHLGIDVPIVMATKFLYPTAQRILDIGCNIGWLVQGFINAGYTACGIDVSEQARENAVCDKTLIALGDMRTLVFYNVYPQYDIAFCLEVLEHMEKESLCNVFQNFKNLAKKIIVTPSDVCSYREHVNVKNHSWWMERFLDNGFRYRHKETLNFHTFLSQERFKPVTNIYPQILRGVMIYDT